MLLEIPRNHLVGLLIRAQQGSEHVNLCGANWVKIKEAELKINLHSPIVQ